MCKALHINLSFMGSRGSIERGREGKGSQQVRHKNDKKNRNENSKQRERDHESVSGSGNLR